jgi:hypothetical protein
LRIPGQSPWAADERVGQAATTPRSACDMT